MDRDALALRMHAIASGRGWGWPALAAAVAFVGATILASFHQQLDLRAALEQRFDQADVVIVVLDVQHDTVHRASPGGLLSAHAGAIRVAGCAGWS